jgi:hypothetical protein
LANDLRRTGTSNPLPSPTEPKVDLVMLSPLHRRTHHRVVSAAGLCLFRLPDLSPEQAQSLDTEMRSNGFETWWDDGRLVIARDDARAAARVVSRFTDGAGATVVLTPRPPLGATAPRPLGTSC